ERQEARRTRVLVTPHRRVAEAPVQQRDAVVLDRAHDRQIELGVLDQANAVAADTQRALQPLADPQQVVVFEKTGRILAAAGTQVVAEVDADRLHRALDRALAASADAENCCHDPGLFRRGVGAHRLHPCEGCLRGRSCSGASRRTPGRGYWRFSPRRSNSARTRSTVRSRSSSGRRTAGGCSPKRCARPRSRIAAKYASKSRAGLNRPRSIAMRRIHCGHLDCSVLPRRGHSNTATGRPVALASTSSDALSIVTTKSSASARKPLYGLFAASSFFHR